MQSHYDEGKPSDRAFMEIMRGADDQPITARLEREARFDPDLWIVEIETDEASLDGLLLRVSP